MTATARSVITLLLLSWCAGQVVADTLSPFSSDGCSGFPDGSIRDRQQWLACCQAHDLAYWQGGTFEQRMHADNQLRTCVAETGEAAVGVMMMMGVWVGGSPYWPTTFRWGYGWPYPRGYKALSALERQQIAHSLAQSNKP